MPTVKPLQWCSWWNARMWMPEIWHPWSGLPSQADEAMANALRSGRVPCRGGDGLDYEARSVRLKEVLPTLQEIQLGPDTVRLTYKKAGGFMIGPLGFFPQQTIKATANFFRPELAWQEFHDELVRSELPEGQLPSDAEPSLSPAPANATLTETRLKTSGASPRPRAHIEKVRQWYRSRVEEYVALGQQSSEDDDWAAAQQEFDRAGRRQQIRDLRRELAPAEWRKQGRRKNSAR